MSSTNETEESLYELLKEVQLEQFYESICNINVTRIEHFDKVMMNDLTDEKVAMSAPAARRLISAAKNKIKERKRRNLLNLILPNRQSSTTLTNPKHNNRSQSLSSRRNSLIPNSTSNGLTCLINSKDIKTSTKLGDGSFGVSVGTVSLLSMNTNLENYK